MINGHFVAISMTLTICNLGLWPYYGIIYYMIYIMYPVINFLQVHMQHAILSWCLQKQWICYLNSWWRPFWKWPWPPITLTFDLIITDSYFATFLWVICLIPFNLMPNMLCFMVVFKMTSILADFLAAILEMTS